MVASRQVEIPYYRGVGREKGRGFGAFVQVLGRTSIPFLRTYVIPATERIGADMLEFAGPEFEEINSGRKSINTAAKDVGRQTLRKQLGERSRKRTAGSRKRTTSRVIPTKSTKQGSRSRRDIFTNISR